MSYINHFNSQFAGEVGLVSLGLGKEFYRYSLGGMYGVVPAEIAGGPLIETITLRQTYAVYYWKRITLYLGLNLFHVLELKYRTHDYGKSPDHYYPLGSIRGLLNIGMATAIDKKETVSIYFEAGLNDLSLTNAINNNQTYDALREVSLGLGFKKRF